MPISHRGGFHDTVGGMPKIGVTRFVDGRIWEVDLFLARTPLLRSALARGRAAEIGGRTVRVMAPEDVVLLKLIASRPRDLADVDDLLLLVAPLDLAYLRGWADRLSLRPALEARLEAGPVQPPEADSGH